MHSQDIPWNGSLLTFWPTEKVTNRMPRDSLFFQYDLTKKNIFVNNLFISSKLSKTPSSLTYIFTTWNNEYRKISILAMWKNQPKRPFFLTTSSYQLLPTSWKSISFLSTMWLPLISIAIFWPPKSSLRLMRMEKIMRHQPTLPGARVNPLRIWFLNLYWPSNLRMKKHCETVVNS